MAAALVAGVVTNPDFHETQPPPPVVIPESSWHPAPPTSTATPTADEPDVVVQPGIALRLQVRSIDFDSATIGPGGTPAPIIPWTEDMNRAHGRVLTPPTPYETGIVQDQTVVNGGLFGTDVNSNGIIAAHATPWTWPEEKLGAFQQLPDIHIGDIVQIDTTEGTLCYTVKETSVLPKGKQVAAYRSESHVVVPGEVYLIVCYRTRDHEVGATKENFIATLQLDQQLTNGAASTGSCW